MKRAMLSTVAAVIACVSLGAQAPAPGTPPTPGTPPSPSAPAPAARAMSGNRDAINVVGCVQGSGSAFKLTQVSDASEPAAEKAAPASSAARPAAKAAGALLDEYSLSADPSVNLSQHVNHKVAVTGTVSKTAASPSAAGGLDAATLTVSALRMVSPTCQ